MVSQFPLADFDIDGIVVEPKQMTLVSDTDYMTWVDTQLDDQNNTSRVETKFFEKPIFIRNDRDLAAIAFNDILYTEAFRAMLIVLEQSILDGAGPYDTSSLQEGFTTFGPSHIVHAMWLSQAPRAITRDTPR